MIKVSSLQNGNALLQFLSKTLWFYDESLTCDYEINNSTAILFLSLKFYASKPEYIFKRINKIKDYRVKLLLLQIDTPQFNKSLREVYRMVPLTVVLCQNSEEAARYIRGFDIAEKRSIDILRNKESSINGFLNEIPKIKTSDISVLKTKFNNLQELIRASASEIADCYGIGMKKAEEIRKYFKMKFNY
ncbi:swi10 [Nucleospora cyclopteri]